MAQLIKTESGELAVQILWYAEDVQETAGNIGEELTDEQIEQVLRVLAKRHDASHGISWETVEAAIDAVLRG